MTWAERRRRLEAIKGALGKPTKNVPDELIEKEKYLEKLETKLERLKREEASSYQVKQCGEEIGRVKRQIEKLKLDYKLF